MSRFGESDEYDAALANLWWANLGRAIRGRRGQRMLGEMLAALEALPEKRLIEGHLVKEGDVCAVGAYVVAQRCAAGKPRDQVLHELALEHARCRCGHGMDSHGNDGRAPCGVCAHFVAEAAKADATGSPYRWEPKACEAFAWPESDDSDEDEWETAEAGRDAGLTTPIAWRLALLNDEDLAAQAPEQRYFNVVAWIKTQLVAPVAPSGVGGSDG